MELSVEQETVFKSSGLLRGESPDD